jgi:hypothetical protein
VCERQAALYNIQWSTPSIILREMRQRQEPDIY